MANIKKWLGKPKMATLQVPAAIKDVVMAFALRLDKSCPQAVKYAATLDETPQVKTFSTFIIKANLRSTGEVFNDVTFPFVSTGDGVKLAPPSPAIDLHKQPEDVLAIYFDYFRIHFKVDSNHIVVASSGDQRIVCDITGLRSDQ